MSLPPLMIFFVAMLAALIAYIVLRIGAGERADILVATPFVAAFVMTPWWAGLAGAAAGHALGVLGNRLVSRTRPPSNDGSPPNEES